MLCVLVAATAFAPLSPVPAAPATICGRAAAPCASLSRRAAIGNSAASLAALAAVTAMPNAALADDTDEAIARIAAKNRVAQEAEKEALKKKLAKNADKVEKENAGSLVLVGLIGTASFVFSLPFFCG